MNRPASAAPSHAAVLRVRSAVRLAAAGAGATPSLASPGYRTDACVQPMPPRERGAHALHTYTAALRAAAVEVLGHVDRCLGIASVYAAPVARRVATPSPDWVLVAGDFALDPRTRTLRRAAGATRLSPSQFLVLLALMRADRLPVTREQLNRVAFASSPGARRGARSLDMCVLQLRRLIESCPREPAHLQTVRSVGFRFDADAPAVLCRHAPTSHTLDLVDR